MSNSLKIWPFEAHITWKDKEELLRYFGAIKVLPAQKRGNGEAVIAM